MLRKIFTLLFLVSALILKSQSIGDSLHAVHYEINISEINTIEKTISAHTIVWISPVLGNVSGISLELIQLNIDSVFVDGNLSDYSHSDGVVLITLETELLFGDTIQIGVYYHGEPFHEAWGGFHFSGDYAFNLGVGFQSIPHNLGKAWFPCIDDFTDRATYDLLATVDNDKKAIGGGLLIETIDNGDGTTTWHWQLNHNIPTYLESVMTGDYVLVEDEYFGIEDTLPINIYVRPQDTAKVAGTFINLKDITRLFEDHFGPYPFGRIGFTATSLGAMEHATNISYPHSGINGGTSLEWWYTHELSHMWFGDMVTCSSAEDMWINEGWATFCQIFYLEEIYGQDEYMETMRDKHQEVLKTTHHVDDGYYALNNIPQQYTYGSTAYDKGATVTNALRTYLGDSIFYDAVTALLQNFAFQSISSYDMRDFLTSHTGINMDGFFESWVFTPGTPHYSIDSTVYNEGQLDIWLKQKFKGADYIGNDNVVQIAYLMDNFDLVFDTVVFSGSIGHSTKQLEFYPLSVIVDPMERMMDATIDNFKEFNSPESYNFPETYFKIIIDQINENSFIQATHNWVYPDSLKVPIPGLKLSNSRYWKIDGFIPDEMQAQGRFYYRNSIYLDGDLIESQTDSIVILFRESAADDWHIIPQYREGIWSIGHIFVNELRKGEYTLAVFDLTVGELKKETNLNYKVYPNPAKGSIKFDFPDKGNYMIQLVDSKGSIIDSLNFTEKRRAWTPRTSNVSPGAYMIYIYNYGKLISVEKIVFVN